MSHKTQKNQNRLINESKTNHEPPKPPTKSTLTAWPPLGAATLLAPTVGIIIGLESAWFFEECWSCWINVEEGG